MPNQNTASEHRYHLLTADRPLSTEKILPREHLLRAVAEGFRGHRFVLLHGKSGIGKTKLAELIFRRGRTENAFAAWYRFTGDFQKDFYLQITDHALLEQLETQIAFGKENGLGSDLIDQRCAHVCRQYWEEYCPGQKLIIIDGVQDFHALAQHLHLLDIPDARVLITTQTLPADDDFRLRDAFSFAVVEVPPLDSSELETMLGYFGQTIEDAQLVEYLGQSPLLLRLFLKNNTPEQPEKSRALVARLLREAPGEDLDGRLIYALLDFADLPPAILWTLMQLAAMPDKFHDPDFIAAIIGLSGVEKKVYTQGYNIFKGKGRNRHSVDEVVRLDEILDWLKAHGWLDVNVYEEVHCHSSLIQPIRKFTQPRYDYFLEQGQQLDLTFFLNENGYDEERLDPADLRLHQVSDNELEQHFAAFFAFVDDLNSDDFRELLTRYADLLEERIEWQKELLIRRRIAASWEKDAEKKVEIRVKPIDRLAGCLNRNGLYKEGLEYSLVLLSELEKVLSSQHPDLAAIYNNVGFMFGKLGDHEKELEYQMKAMEISEVVLPPQHPDLAACYNNLGFAFGNLGNLEKALEYEIKALEIWEAVLPPQHPSLAGGYNNVGGAFGALGDHTKALEYAMKALEIQEAVLPPQHPDLAGSYNNVGGAFGALSDHEKALEYAMKALEIWEAVLQPKHPSLASGYNNVGKAYGVLGDFEKALEFLLKALEIREDALSPLHPDLKASYINVGGAFGTLGDHTKALEYIMKALEISETVLPKDYPDLANSYYNIAFRFQALDDHEKALEYLLKALEIWEGVLPSQHTYRSMLYKNIAFAYLNLNDPINAEKYRRLANPEP